MTRTGGVAGHPVFVIALSDIPQMLGAAALRSLGSNRAPLFVSQNEKDRAVQGVAVGRLLRAARDRPVGRVTLCNDGGAWLNGRLSRTPTTSPDPVDGEVWTSGSEALTDASRDNRL